MKPKKTTQEVIFEASSNYIKVFVVIVSSILMAYPLVWLTIELGMSERLFRIIVFCPILITVFFTLKYQIGERLTSIILPTVKKIDYDGKIISISTNPAIITRHLYKINVEIVAEIEYWNKQAGELEDALEDIQEKILTAFDIRKELLEEELAWLHSQRGAPVTFTKMRERIAHRNRMFALINKNQTRFNRTYLELHTLIETLDSEWWNKIYDNLKNLEKVTRSSWASRRKIKHEYRRIREQENHHKQVKQEVRSLLEHLLSKDEYNSLWEQEEQLYQRLEGQEIICSGGQIYKFSADPRETTEYTDDSIDADKLL